MGLINFRYYDAFISYAHDDNVLHDDAVQVFQRFLKPRFEAEFRLLSASKGEAEVFMDSSGLPANGDLTNEIQEALTRTVFLIILPGQVVSQFSVVWKRTKAILGSILGGTEGSA